MAHHRTKPPGQQRSYGVLVGTIRDGQEDPAEDAGSRNPCAGDLIP